MIKPVMSHIPENQMSLIIQKRSNSLYNHSITYCSITPFFSPKRHLAIFEKLAIYTILLQTVSSECIGFKFGVHPLVRKCFP